MRMLGSVRIRQIAAPRPIVGLFLVASITILAFHFSQIANEYGPNSVEIEVSNVKDAIVELHPEVSSIDSLDQALILLNIVHDNVEYRDGSWSKYRDLDDTFMEAVNGRGSHLCQGLSFIYMTALRAFDIDSRYVGMFRTNFDAPTPVRSHASVEALIGTKWIALDPTHNMTIRAADGARIGWAKARAYYADGHTIAFVDEGSRQGRSVLDDWKSEQELMDLMYFMVIGPSRQSEPIVFPNDWDGIIEYNSGASYDTTKFTGVYQRLASK